MLGCGLKLAGGLGRPWSRDGGVPQDCPLSMMFIVALYLPWRRNLAAHEGVQPRLYADNLKCVSRDPDLLLNAARFTTGYVRLVGQEPAPRKCVLMRTSRAVRCDMRDWVVTDEGDRWSVKFDIRDLGGILTLPSGVGLLPWLLRFVSLLLGWCLSLLCHWIFMGASGFFRSMFIPGSLQVLIEASVLADAGLRWLRAATVRVVWSRRQSLANPGAVLGLLDGPAGVILRSALLGSGFVCSVGFLLIGRVRLPGFIGF